MLVNSKCVTYTTYSSALQSGDIFSKKKKIKGRKVVSSTNCSWCIIRSLHQWVAVIWSKALYAIFYILFLFLFLLAYHPELAVPSSDIVFYNWLSVSFAIAINIIMKKLVGVCSNHRCMPHRSAIFSLSYTVTCFLQQFIKIFIMFTTWNYPECSLLRKQQSKVNIDTLHYW